MSQFVDDIIDDLKDICILSNLKFKHAAALICNQKIIAKGYNFKNPGHVNSIHAEMSVILHLPKKMLDTLNLDIVVIRLSANGVILNSKPCYHCLEKIKKHNIRNVYYSDTNGSIVCEKVANMESMYICSGFRKTW